MITITVVDRDGERKEIEIPEDINLSLMEVLIASEYNFLATCGGIALCATCHVQILEGLERLPAANNAELDMLDTLPDAGHGSRLSCQINVDQNLDKAVVSIRGDEQ